jgi:hypothetical protein
VAEQVSHHPPISVAVAESQHWNLVQEATAKTAMRPSSLKITPLGFVRLLFPALGERYEWHKVTTQVEDIVSGNKWCDHHGKMLVANVNTGDVCKVGEVGAFAPVTLTDTCSPLFFPSSSDLCLEHVAIFDPHPISPLLPPFRRSTSCNIAYLAKRRSLTSKAVSSWRLRRRSPC